MALVDPTAAIITAMNDITHIAGEEPWNKNLDSFIINSLDTDSSSYQCDWKKWHGVYRKIPEARSTIDLWCKWVVGKEIKFKSETQKKIVERIKGNGIQTFRTILINHKRVSKTAGDSYIEKMRDKAGRLVNLKVLNPGTIKVTANSFGIIEKYEQVSTSNKSPIPVILNTWEGDTLDNIWHLANDPIADEIHGIPEIEKLYDIIKWKYQLTNITSVVFRRYIAPILDIYANTDDPTELTALKTMYDNSVKYFENRIIPKGAIDHTERVSVPQYSTLDPLPMLMFYRSYFTESSNVPDLIRGKSDEVSLAAGKLNYLGFKEKIIMEQIEYAEQIKQQLGIDLKFSEPKEIDLEIAKTNQDMNDRRTAKENKVVTTGKTKEDTDKLQSQTQT